MFGIWIPEFGILRVTRYDIMQKHILISCILTATVLSGCGKNMSIVNYPNEGGNIICFGDSLTRGQSAGKGNEYPAVLAGMVKRHVINAGVDGHTTGNGLSRIDRDVLAKDPYMVIIEFGANDVFQDKPEDITMLNMELIVEKVQTAGAISVIYNIGDGGGDAKYDIYSRQMKELARETGSVYIGNLLKGIRNKPELTTDQIHPNAEGYKIVADRVYRGIRDYL